MLFLGVTLGWFPGVNIWALIGPFFLIALGIWFLIRPRFPKNADFKVTEDAIALEGAKEAKVSIEHGAGKLIFARRREGRRIAGWHVQRRVEKEGHRERREGHHQAGE